MENNYQDEDIEEEYHEPPPPPLPEMKVIIGSKVLACNIHAINRANDSAFDAGRFYEEGTVIEVHDDWHADVQFANGDVLMNGKISAFRHITH